jgi:hypothetical protein
VGFAIIHDLKKHLKNLSDTTIGIIPKLHAYGEE